MKTTNKFRYFRKRAGYTQEQVAEVLGVKQSNISFWETGRAYPRVKTILRLAKLYGCTVDELLS